MKTQLAVKAVAVACTLFASSFSFAAGDGLSAGDTISLGNGPGGNGGGAFNVSILTGAAAPGSFQTFCLEYNETFSSYGQTLRVKAVNTGAEKGGVAGQTSTNFDPISGQTAYLYTQFRSGNLSGYDYYSGSEGTASQAQKNDGTALQLAFWRLEDEIAYSSSNSGAQTLYRKYFDSNGNVKVGLGGDDLAVATQTNSWLAEANNANWGNDIGYVRVLNLEKWAKVNDQWQWTYSQDQLTMVPEPETYAMMLAGLGLIGFMARRRLKLL